VRRLLHSWKIDPRRGDRPWRAVRSVEDRSDAITFVSSNGNALIVPNRAFSDKSARQVFLNDARRWHAGVDA